jgi:hypothetical protein
MKAGDCLFFSSFLAFLAFLHHLIWPGDSSMVHEVDPSELSFFASNFFAQTISDASCLSF